MADKLYECTNKDGCVLGAVGQSGYFTGGMTASLKAAKSGIPAEQLEEGKDFGEGICPECGKKGKEIGVHESLVGKDDK